MDSAFHEMYVSTQNVVEHVMVAHYHNYFLFFFFNIINNLPQHCLVSEVKITVVHFSVFISSRRRSKSRWSTVWKNNVIIIFAAVLSLTQLGVRKQTREIPERKKSTFENKKIRNKYSADSAPNPRAACLGNEGCEAFGRPANQSLHPCHFWVIVSSVKTYPRLVSNWSYT